MGRIKGYWEIANVGGNPFRSRKRKVVQKMEQGDLIIYTLFKGKMELVNSPRGPETRYNFLIVCDYGDWSGFRTLKGCVKQFAELEYNARFYHRGDGFYKVVERF